MPLPGRARQSKALAALGVLPSVLFWLLTGEARLGASSLLRAVSLPLAPSSGLEPTRPWQLRAARVVAPHCGPLSTDTRADPASARRAAGAARGRVGRAGGPLWCGPSLGAGAFCLQNSSPTSSLARAGVSSLFLSTSQVVRAPCCAPLSAQPRPAAGRATPWPGPPCDRPPQSASVEEVSRLA